MSDHEQTLADESGDAGTGENALTERYDGPPQGLRCANDEGYLVVDAMAGATSVFGLGYSSIVDTMKATAEQYLGTAPAAGKIADRSEQLVTSFENLLSESKVLSLASVQLCPSADSAVDVAIARARCQGSEHRFRTIGLVGSDHGRTGMCRSASGRPELRSQFGPMMAGFTHLPLGDLDAASNAIDDQTACVLITPVELHRAVRAIEPSFLSGIRELCNQHSVPLIIDERWLTLGASGQLFSIAAVLEIEVDAIILSAGLFGGLNGGAILANSSFPPIDDSTEEVSPVSAAVASQTLVSMIAEKLPGSATESMQSFAVSLADRLSQFEFVRDLHALGMTLGVELDVAAETLITEARRCGVHLVAAGDYGIRLQLPLVMTDEERELLLQRLVASMEAVERATTSLAV